MKNNLPITGHEVLFAVDKTMVTKTDAEGIITFANLDFIEISGFSENELLGSNHNIIRHPDMPAATFETMWNTLKRGFSWNGIIKNRCKNGDHYWVNAKVIPIKKNGEITGYMSVRTCPSREEVAKAVAAYKIATTNTEKNQHNVPANWRTHWSIRNGIVGWILVVTLMLIAGGILGISGLNMSVLSIQTLQHEELEPVQIIGRINYLMSDNRAQVAMAMRQDSEGSEVTQPTNFVPDYIDAMVRNKAEIDRLWSVYVGRIKVAEEKELADNYVKARSQFVQEGLLKVKQAIDEKNYLKAERLFTSSVTPAYEKANAAATDLLGYLTQRSRDRVDEITAYSQATVKLAFGGLGLCFMVLVVGGMFFYRVTVIPLEEAVRALEKIAEGDLSSQLAGAGYGEPGRVTDALWVTQTRLKVMMYEMRKSSKSIRAQCSSLNLSMMNLAEQSDEQHDRVYQSVDAVVASSRAVDEISELMESMLLNTTGEGCGQNFNTATEVKYAAIEPIPGELLALFGEEAIAPPERSVAVDPSAAAPVPDEVELLPTERAQFDRQMHGVVSAIRVQSFVVNDLVSQLKQVGALNVENRSDVQAAWAASQRLEATAHELDQMVKYFD